MMATARKNVSPNAFQQEPEPEPSPTGAGAPRKEPARAATYALIVLATVIWGGTWSVGHFMAASLPAFTNSFLRFAIASVPLLAAARLMEGSVFGGAFPKQHVTWADVGFFTLAGLTGVFAYNIAFFTGLRTVNSSTGSLIVAFSPVITIILAAMVLREPLTWRKLAGAAISFTGVAVVLLEAISASGVVGSGAGESGWTGGLLLVFAAAMWASYGIIGKLAMRRYSALVTTAWASAIGAALLLPGAIYENAWRAAFSSPWTFWAAMGYMAILSSVLAFVWWYHGIKSIGAGKASVFLNLVPVLAVVIGAGFLGEPFTAQHLAGGLLVLAGVTLANTSR